MPAIVYLHGLGSSSAAFLPGVASCAGLVERRSILIDFLGFGQSDRPDDFGYAVDDHAQVVAAVLERLLLTGCAVIGHSLGGSIAIRLAATRPELVSQLVAAEANLEPGPQEGSNAVFSRGIALQSEAVYCERGYQKTLEWADGAAPAFAAQLRMAHPRAIHRTAVSLVAGTTPRLMEQLLALTTPPAYVFGELSLANEDMAEREAQLRAAGVRVLVIPGAGHDMRLEEAPEVFAAAVLPALSSPER
jgi:pimeloyl-ACP methyl ester carboxylesterase